MHHLKLFVEDGVIVYIHHDEDHPASDEPGKHLKLKGGQKLKFKARDGDLNITFKAGSPFKSGRTVLNAVVGKFTSPTEEVKDVMPPPNNPSFPYTADVGGIAEDPEIIIGNTGGGGGDAKKPKTKKSKGKKKK